MAYGDVKIPRARGNGGGYYTGYDDEGRTKSKALYERFEHEFLSVPEEDRTETLQDESWGLTNYSIAEIAQGTVFRYGVHDFCDGLWSTTFYSTYEGRVQKLIVKHCGENAWESFWHRTQDAIFMAGIADSIESKVRRTNWIDWKERRQAEIIANDTQQKEEIMFHAELSQGAIRMAIADAIKPKMIYEQSDGDELDDPLECYRTGYGWATEVKEARGVKLQITLSLDISNSNVYNDISQAAHSTFLKLGLAIEQLQTEFQGSVFFAPFVWSGGRSGKYCRRLKDTRDKEKMHETQDYHMGAFEHYRRYSQDLFHGEDTWMNPLLREIAAWEKNHSDPGAVKIDLVISDATFEHPTDITKCSEFQSQRNGNLRTVILNLMPEEDWHDTPLPMRCFQYPVSTANVDGILKRVLVEYLANFN